MVPAAGELAGDGERAVAPGLGLDPLRPGREERGRSGVVVPVQRLRERADRGPRRHREPDVEARRLVPLLPVPVFERNVERDRRNREGLEWQGWRVVTAWECELRDEGVLAARLEAALRTGPDAD